MANRQFLKSFVRIIVLAMAMLSVGGLIVLLVTDEGREYLASSKLVSAPFVPFIDLDKPYGRGLPMTPLMWHALHDNTSMVKLLLWRGASVNARANEQTALMCACYTENHELVEVLLQHGADVHARDKPGWTALMHHCFRRKAAPPTILQMLLDRGADLNVHDAWGLTALHLAAGSRGGDAIVRLLLERGAEINPKITKSTTPLHWSLPGDISTMKLLLDRGADINATYKKGPTVLSVAAGECGVDKMKLLIERGAQVNPTTPTIDGLPLIRAITKGCIEGVALLLNHGASTKVTNSSGMTAQELASRYGHHEIVELLRTAGATQ